MSLDGAPPPAAAAPDDRPADPTPAQWRVGTWLAELLSVPTGLIDSYLPGSDGMPARTREQLILSISEINDCRYSAWVHGAWLEFLGARELDEALVPLFEYGRACAEAGVPLDTTTLEAVYPAPMVRSVRATVAHAQIANIVGNTADEMVAQSLDRISTIGARRAPAVHVSRENWGVRDWVEGACTVALGMPLALPAVTTAFTMKAIARLAPKLPEITLPGADANLVAHLLAEAAPTYLGHAIVRTSLVWSPLQVAIAFRMEGMSATIRVGRGRVAIENGVQPDALMVVDGGVEPLVQTVAGTILRDMGVPIRRTRH